MWKITEGNCAFLIILILISLCKYTESQERMLFWGVEAQGASHLIIAEGDPDIWIPSVRDGGNVDVHYKSINTTLRRIGAIASDYNGIREVFIFDQVYGNIELFTTPRGVDSAIRVYRGTSHQFADMSLDWVSRNLYYTDGDIIGIYSNRTGKAQILLEGLNTPFGIASDPLHGYLFWTEVDAQRIQRSNSNGSSIVTLLENTDQPQQLIADHRDQFIYWINGLSRQVERVDYNGNNHSIVTPTSVERLSGLEIYKDYLLVVYADVPTLRIYSKTGEHVTYLRFTSAFPVGKQQGISMASPENQPATSSPCKTSNGGCDHICIHDDVHGMSCLCDYGFSLNQDGRTCGTKTVTQNFLLAMDNEADKLYQINLDTEEVSAIMKDANAGANGPEAVTYDPIDQTVYWTDRGSQVRIRNKNLVSGTEEVFWELEAGGSTQGLAIDISGRALYYTDNALKRLTRVPLGTRIPAIFLLLAATDKPLAVLIHQTDKQLYWTNWGSNPTIEKINIPTGNGLTTLVSSNIHTPTGLALDTQAAKLYWVDNALNRLERISLDGTDREFLLDLSATRLLDIVLVNNVLYASSTGQILRINTADLTMNRLGHEVLSNLFGIFAHTEGTFTTDPGSPGAFSTTKPTSSTKLPTTPSTTTIGPTTKSSIMTSSTTISSTATQVSGTVTPDPGSPGTSQTTKLTSSTKSPNTPSTTTIEPTTKNGITTTVGPTTKNVITTLSSGMSSTTTPSSGESAKQGLNLTTIIIIAVSVGGVILLAVVISVTIVCVRKHRNNGSPSANQIVLPPGAMPGSNQLTAQNESQRKSSGLYDDIMELDHYERLSSNLDPQSFPNLGYNPDDYLHTNPDDTYLHTFVPRE